MTSSLVQVSKEEFLNLLMSGDHSGCSELVHNALMNKISVTGVYEGILKQALYDVGELWEHNKIGVATEHLASAIVEGILNEMYPKIIPKDKINKTVLVSCVENEYHQIGIKMVSDIFEMNGWRSYFLGANIPTIELIDFARSIKPDILAISISISSHMPLLQRMILMIKEEFPGLLILVGGQAFRNGGQEVLSKLENVIYLSDLKSAELFIRALNPEQ
jgi:methanogenic corrinoid protein MtbC1